jgi:hypothetical protein
LEDKIRKKIVNCFLLKKPRSKLQNWGGKKRNPNDKKEQFFKFFKIIKIRMQLKVFKKNFERTD